jgi:hypothetical protein
VDNVETIGIPSGSAPPWCPVVLLSVVRAEMRPWSWPPRSAQTGSTVSSAGPPSDTLSHGLWPMGSAMSSLTRGSLAALLEEINEPL